MKEIVFSCPPAELSCIVGNLFVGIDPPCDAPITENGLVICGTTHSGRQGRLHIHKDYCLFYGEESDLAAVRGGVCVERRCRNG